MEEIEYVIMYWDESSAMKYMKTLGLLHIINNRVVSDLLCSYSGRDVFFIIYGTSFLIYVANLSYISIMCGNYSDILLLLNNVLG